MGYQIIEQPDGNLALFCSNTDTIVTVDASDDELVEWFAEQAAADARRKARKDVDNVRADRASASYHQFTMTWAEALESDQEHGGEVWQEYV